MRYRIFPHVEKNRFFNFPGEKKPHFFLPTLKSYVQWYWKVQTHADKGISKQWTLQASKIACPEPENSCKPHITWIGHASFLIKINGVTLLTDPIFFNLPLFNRILAPGVDINTLGNIDYVLISHNHLDHMNLGTIRWLCKRYPQIQFLVPYGNKEWFRIQGINRAQEYMWWEDTTAGIGKQSFRLTFLPARHWSGRGIFDYNKSLWGSWMISTDKHMIYFAGDSAYGPHFKAIAHEFYPIDIALLPIGPCEPEAWMRDSHMSAEEAGGAFLDLHARTMIPMHWGTFYFGLDDFLLPYKRLCQWWKKQEFGDKKRLCALKMGESMICKEVFERPPKKTTLLPHFYHNL